MKRPIRSAFRSKRRRDSAPPSPTRGASGGSLRAGRKSDGHRAIIRAGYTCSYPLSPAASRSMPASRTLIHRLPGGQALEPRWFARVMWSVGLRVTGIGSHRRRIGTPPQKARHLHRACCLGWRTRGASRAHQVRLERAFDVQPFRQLALDGAVDLMLPHYGYAGGDSAGPGRSARHACRHSSSSIIGPV